MTNATNVGVDLFTAAAHSRWAPTALVFIFMAATVIYVVLSNRRQ